MHRNCSSNPGYSNGTKTPHPEYRPDVDGLRAIAVGGVLVYHAFPDLLPGGFVGVDIFFVISGYLITRVIIDGLHRSDFSISNFYARRVRRIFPALLLVLSACLIFGWITQLAEDYAQLGKHTAGGASFAANLMLWSEAGYFDQASASKPLLHLWSLGIEEQFYLAWPLMLIGAYRAQLPLLLFIVCTAVISFLINLHHQIHDPVAAFYSPLSRAWELMIGGMLAYWASAAGAGERAWWRGRLSLASLDFLLNYGAVIRTLSATVGLGMVALALLFLDSHKPFPGAYALLPTVGAALLIASGPHTFIDRWLLARRPLVWIGLISYPLYLWHWPLLTFAKNAYGTLSNEERAGLLLASVMLAWITWGLVERPFRSSAHGRLKVTVLLLGMIATASLGTLIWLKDGVPSRYPDIIKRATEYDLVDYRESLRYQMCFIEPGTSAEQYSEECVDPGQGPLWVLWGDSSAAALYIGVRHLQQKTGSMRLAQFTSSSCPPLADFDGPNPDCRDNNRWTLDRIAQLKPDTVLMAAMWNDYELADLEDTIAQLKTGGVRRVVVLGQAPSWKDTPSRIVFNSWRVDPLHQPPGARLDYAKHGRGQVELRPGNPRFGRPAGETTLKVVAAETGSQFISLSDVLCNEAGCLTRADSESGETFYLDIVHLTPAGSRYTIGLIGDNLLEGTDSAAKARNF